MANKPVTIQEEHDLMQELLANADHCTMLNSRQKIVLKSIDKKLKKLYKIQKYIRTSKKIIRN